MGPRAKQKNHRKSKRAFMERLETRRVLDAGTASLVGGLLRVCGTDEAETITVAELADSYFVFAPFLTNSQLFAKTEVNAIRIQGGGGNDTIVPPLPWNQSRP